MRENAILVLVGLMCVYPMVFGVVGYFIGRKRLRFRSPVTFDKDGIGVDRTKMQVSKAVLRRIEPIQPREPGA